MSYGTVCGVEGPGFAEAATILFNDAFSTPITGADPTALNRHWGALRLLTKNAMLAAMGKASGGIQKITNEGRRTKARVRWIPPYVEDDVREDMSCAGDSDCANKYREMDVCINTPIRVDFCVSQDDIRNYGEEDRATIELPISNGQIIRFPRVVYEIMNKARIGLTEKFDRRVLEALPATVGLNRVTNSTAPQAMQFLQTGFAGAIAPSGLADLKITQDNNGFHDGYDILGDGVFARYMATVQISSMQYPAVVAGIIPGIRNFDFEFYKDTLADQVLGQDVFLMVESGSLQLLTQTFYGIPRWKLGEAINMGDLQSLYELVALKEALEWNGNVLKFSIPLPVPGLIADVRMKRKECVGDEIDNDGWEGQMFLRYRIMSKPTNLFKAGDRYDQNTGVLAGLAYSA